jgi:hypothetical protein
MAGVIPAIPILWNAAHRSVGIAGTGPVMTGRGHLRPFPG